jgi:hypothetical protein
MKNLNFKESSDLSRQNSGSQENFDCVCNYPEGDFTDLFGGVSYGSEDEWMSGLEIHDDEPTIFSSEPNIDISNHHHVYAILKETLEELDPDGNPYVNPLNLRRGSKYAGEGETKATVASKEKVQLITAKWVTIRAAINDTTTIPSDAPRNVLMGY